MQSKIDRILELAKNLRTGLTDPRSLQKLSDEREELAEAVAEGDELGAILEAADCAYFAIKAHWNELLPKEERDELLGELAVQVQLTTDQVLDAAITKYEVRSSGEGKDDAAEREAVTSWLNAQ